MKKSQKKPLFDMAKKKFHPIWSKKIPQLRGTKGKDLIY